MNRPLAATLLFVAAVWGWLHRRGRRTGVRQSVAGRVMGLWIRLVFRPISDRALEFDLNRARRGIESARFLPPPAGVTVEGVRAGQIAAEWLTPERVSAGRHLLYLHGGGFMMGGLGSHRRWVGSLARALHARALHLEYRVAPEFPFPASLDDCVTAYRWLLAKGVDPKKLVIAGESAGAGLVISTLLRVRDFTFSGPSHARNADYLEARGLHSMAKLYLGGHDPLDPLVSSVFADLTGLPPTYLVAGGAELLLSDTELLAARARQCGVDVTVRVVPGMLHAFPVMRFLPESRHVLRDVREFVDAHTQSENQLARDRGATDRSRQLRQP